MTIELDRAIELYIEKQTAYANKLIKIFDERPDVQLLNGRYGAYLKIGKDNFKLPKDTTPENLSVEECIHISKNQAPKTAKKKVFRKK